MIWANTWLPSSASVTTRAIQGVPIGRNQRHDRHFDYSDRTPITLYNSILMGFCHTLGQMLANI